MYTKTNASFIYKPDYCCCCCLSRVPLIHFHEFVVLDILMTSAGLFERPDVKQLTQLSMCCDVALPVLHFGQAFHVWNNRLPIRRLPMPCSSHMTDSGEIKFSWRTNNPLKMLGEGDRFLVRGGYNGICSSKGAPTIEKNLLFCI